jgi:serine/threonine-protein kinase
VIHLRTLGHIDCRDDEGREFRALLAQPKRLAILVYLVSCSRVALCRRDALLAMFWPESDTDRARSSLRQALHFIRQELGDDVIVTRGSDEIGIRAGAICLDTQRFEQLAADGENGAAIALYTGDFLAGFFVRQARDFERWVDSERVRLRHLATDVAWHRVEELLQTGDHGAARRLGERAVELSDVSEEAVRRLVGLLAKGGERAAAIATYRSFAVRLQDEYGVVPSRETRALIESLSSELDAEVPDVPPPAPAAPIVSIAPLDRPDAETALPRDTPRPTLTSRARRWRPIRFAVAAVAMILVASAFWFRQSNPRTSDDSDRVVILPFLVRASTDLTYLQDGLPLLLSARFDGTGHLQSVEPRAVLLDVARHPGALDVERARQTATRLDARLYVLGAIVGSASSLHLSAALYDRESDGKPIAQIEVEGKEAELARLVDRVAAALLVNRVKNDAELAASAARTTESLVALKAWLSGERALAAGQYEPAISAFRSAVAADSTFALAYFRMAFAANWAGRPVLADSATTRAVAMSDRLPPIDRILVHAFVHEFRGHFVAAESSYRAVLDERPLSVEAWYELAETGYHGNPGRGLSMLTSRATFEHVLQLDPHNFPAMVHLARIAATEGDRPALDQYTSTALRGTPDGPHRAELLLLRWLALHDGESRQYFFALETADPAALDALWRAAESTGALAASADVAERFLRSTTAPEMRAGLWVLLAHLALGRDQFELAERHLDSLATLAPRSAAALRMSFALHAAGSPSQRQRRVARARALADATPLSSEPRLLYIGARTTDADAARVAGDSSLTSEVSSGNHALLLLEAATTAAARAVALCEVAALDSINGTRFSNRSPFAPRAALLLALARVLDAEGRTTEALARLASVPEDFGFNVGYLAEVHRYRATLLDRLGRPADAKRERAAARAMIGSGPADS